MNGRKPVFGEVIDGEAHLTPAGETIQGEWMGLVERYFGMGIG